MDQLVENTGFHYITKTIFNYFDQNTLCACRLVSKSWCEYIDYEKLNWIQILLYQSIKLSDWLDQNNNWSNAIRGKN